jgi:hypothetical protein
LENLEAQDMPENVPTVLFAYRDPEHEVRYLELTPAAAAILEALFGGATLRDAMMNASSSLGLSLDGSMLEGAARLLSDLEERGALLGGTI